MSIPHTPPRRVLQSLLLALVPVLLAAPPAVAAIDAELRVGREPDRTRLVVDLSEPATYHVFSLSDPARIVIDLRDTRLTGPVAPDLFAATPVARLRTGMHADTGLRLVLDLAREDVQRKTFVLDPNGDAGHRLVVDLYHGVADPAAVDPPVAAAPTGATESATTTTTLVAAREPARPVSRPARPAPRPESAAAAVPAGEPQPAVSDLHLGGYGELAGAWNTADPEHWSKLRARLELGLTGRLDWGARFKLSGRMEGDGAYSVEDDVYPSAVRRDQRSDFSVREAYLDFGAGAWEFRLGRQHVVWGEMVGLFLADVVSARDTREFFLEEFETMRIPQWAVRAERFAGDAHLELLWVPYPSYDEIGKPGADFYPFPVPAGTSVREITPSRSKPSNHGLGGRFSYLVDGWDLSGFYYQSTDVAPTLYRTDAGLELRHERIRQVGATFSKGWRDFVLKGEAVYTSGRSFLSLDPAARFGLQESDAVDYVLGVMIHSGDWRFDAQFYGRHVFDHDRAMGFDANETGLTLLLNRRFGDSGEAEVLYLTGLNRSDWSLQPSVSWNLTQAWRLRFGADLFGGDSIGLFGQYDDSDRVFVELRRWF